MKTLPAQSLGQGIPEEEEEGRYRKGVDNSDPPHTTRTDPDSPHDGGPQDLTQRRWAGGLGLPGGRFGLSADLPTDWTDGPVAVRSIAFAHTSWWRRGSEQLEHSRAERPPGRAAAGLHARWTGGWGAGDRIGSGGPGSVRSRQCCSQSASCTWKAKHAGRAQAWCLHSAGGRVVLLIG